MGMVDFTEPFTRLLNQGMVLMDGSAMSKSRGNLVKLSDEAQPAWGGRHPAVDGLRRTPEDDIDWADVSRAGPEVPGPAWRLAGDVASAPASRLRAETSTCAKF